MKYAILTHKANGDLFVFGAAHGIQGVFKVLDHAAEMDIIKCHIVNLDEIGITLGQLRILCEALNTPDLHDDDVEEVVVRRYVR